ncbi:hypothetical protein BC827DRAFT_1188030 [Russula dissimulans]|nr:hypothetical protein BC827DRAFT_1188030 [Russula dissimulans]
MEPSSPSIATVVTVEARGVRFDDECILIPDPQPRSRVPKLLAKSSSFIFKRRHSHAHTHDLPSPTSPRDYDPSQSLLATPRSALSRNPAIQRRSSLPPPSRVHRATRLPPLPHTPLVTVPLRPCCPDCFSATENAALQGDDWTENFTRSAHRRRSASVDNRPFPPHLPDNGSTIRWSMVKESPPRTFHSVVVLDEADHDVTRVADDVPSASDEQGLNEVRKALDRLSVEAPVVDGILPPLLSRNKPRLSPILSNNPSVVDLPPRPIAADDLVDNVPAANGALEFGSGSASPAASPLLQTPSSSPTVSSSSPRQRERESSPRIPGSFRLPKRSTLMRAGSDILKGVSVMGGAPI